MNAPTDWISAIAILAAGLIIGVLFVVLFNRKKSAHIHTDLAQKDLEAKRDALITQLRALPDDAVDERARLERETADVLRKLDQHTPPADPAPATAQPRNRATTSPAVTGFLWGAGSFAALAALAYFVMQSATPREQQTAPMAQQPSNPATQQPDPGLIQLETAVQKDPNNLALRNDLAQAYLERDNLMAVFDQTKFVLERNPSDSRALTFQALVRMAMGEADTAAKMLQAAIRSDPKNLDGWVALAWVHAQSNRMSDAEAAIAEAIKVSPNDRARLMEVLQQMKTHATQPAAAELPPDHPPLAPANAAGGNVRITLSLATAAPPRGVLFVIARGPGGGPPVAVKRLAAGSFPITLDLGQADSMMGQQLPATFRIEARLDSDGDPLTKPASDPSAFVDGVVPGAAITLALK